MGDVFFAGRHPVKGAVRLHVAELNSRSVQKAFQRTDLVEDDVGHFLPVDLHLAAAESGQVGE